MQHPDQDTEVKIASTTVCCRQVRLWISGPLSHPNMPTPCHLSSQLLLFCEWKWEVVWGLQYARDKMLTSPLLAFGKNIIVFKALFIFILCACTFFLDVCKGTHRVWKRAQIPWNETVVRHHMGAENQTSVLCKNSKVRVISLAPHVIILLADSFFFFKACRCFSPVWTSTQVRFPWEPLLNVVIPKLWVMACYLFYEVFLVPIAWASLFSLAVGQDHLPPGVFILCMLTLCRSPSSPMGCHTLSYFSPFSLLDYLRAVSHCQPQPLFPLPLLFKVNSLFPCLRLKSRLASCSFFIEIGFLPS